jgi:type IX secretion system PorP/SprF family membrane protein
MKTLVFLVLVLSAPLTVLAQQDPLYAQYMNNPLAINPAYAGTHKMLFSTLQYRTQWAGLSGNPVTVNFSSHMPVIADKMGLGLQVIQDRIGENKNTEFNASYSYQIEMGASKLCFGIQAGFVNFSNDPDDLEILDQDDPAFFPYSETKFNTGAGLLLTNHDRFILGLRGSGCIETGGFGD